MALLIKYLRGHRSVILAQILFTLIFTLIFALYDLPLLAVAYPALLCLLIGLSLILVDFHRARKKHSSLEHIARQSAALIGDLPDTGCLEDEDYQQIIRNLQKEFFDLENKTDIRYRDMMDYYTIWAHQIKTPISSMRLCLQDNDTPSVSLLQADLFRIEQYVDMVLTFLRLDSTSTDYTFREYDLDSIIRSSVRKFSHEFISRHLSLQYEAVNTTIITDSKWLSFVIEQLLSNALKYTRSGCIRIYRLQDEAGESAAAAAPSGENITTAASSKILCIEDTGMGITPQDLPRIFEKGYTGCNGRTDKKASGLGLYLCKRICDNLGIAISAESVLGKGTCVKLDLSQYKIRKD